MLTFKQLNEALDLKIHKHESGGTVTHAHEYNVNGNKVVYTYSQLNSKRPKSFAVDMYVNGSADKHGDLSAKDGAHVIRTLSNDSANRFIKDHKPQSLEALGNTAHKHKLYKILMKRMATKHGGTYSPANVNGYAEVKFK